MNHPLRRTLRRAHRCVFSALAILMVGLPLTAQQVPEGGLMKAGLLLRQLEGVKRVLMIGAHPDDEDTNLLAVLARGMGAETAYLSITRGDGGQNLIGPELGEGLGVIRTGELEAARGIDGAVQFFGRAFDYGYSKSADEAFRHWPRDEVVRDAVWVIRTFRPQIIVSVWSGTPRDGHGQHWASGIVANEAFEAAADPARYPDLPGLGGEAWAADKLFHSARWRGSQSADSIPTGDFDPLLAASYRQVAGASRSQHRSQDMGTSQPLGPGGTAVVLVESRVGEGPYAPMSPDGGIFAGIDTTLAGLVAPLGDTEAGTLGIGRYRNAIAEARDNLGVAERRRAVRALMGAVESIRQTRDAAREALDPNSLTVHELDRRVELTQRALLAAAGIVVEVRSSDDLLVPGETATLDIHLWNSSAFEIGGALVEATVPGHGEAATAEGFDLAPGEMATWTIEAEMDSGTAPDEQYFLTEPRDGDLYRWPDRYADMWGLPRNPARFQGTVRFELRDPTASAATTIEVTGAARYVGVDKALGEFEKPVLVVPALSVAAEPAVMAWPLADRAPRTIRVALRNEAAAGSSGQLRLDLPSGWTAEPAAHPFDLAEASASRSFEFRVTPGAGGGEGRHVIGAYAVTDAGRRYDRRVDVLDYPHIERTLMFAPAATEVAMFPVAVPDGLRVGYVMGSGDDGLEALRQMGVQAELVPYDQLASGQLDAYDVLVLGIRVYETRPDVAAVNDRILEFAEGGGTVVVQYNKYEYPAGNYAPYPVSMGSRPVERVTDPESPVEFPSPDHPALDTPNDITLDDFEGWVQERGLYFLKEWDERYTPILGLTDPGEPPMYGSTVVAPVGEGAYVYVALSFFRQFPAGVPGAYRLFANLVSLSGDRLDPPR